MGYRLIVSELGVCAGVELTLETPGIMSPLRPTPRPPICSSRGASWGAVLAPHAIMAGRFARVVCLMALILPGATAVQAGPRDPAALAQEGAKALDERRFGDALDAFTQAAALVPRDPGLCAGAGMAAFMLGRNDAAQEWFEKALRLNPRYRTAAQWLGELHYRAGRVSDAINVYEAALTHAPRASELETRLGEWRKEAELQSRFYEARGAHFAVRFEGAGDEMLARRAVERLESEYWRIGQVLTAYPPNPITVVLYTQQQFRDITRMPTWTAAAYDGRIHVPMRGALEQTEELDRVLGHEFVHAVVVMLGGRNVPVWLNEGLATILERGGAEESERVLAATRARPALQQLHRSFSGLSGADAQVAYSLSAKAVRRMMDLRSPSAVVTLLQDLARGVAFATAFHQNIGMRYEDFQAMLARE
jgi:tetratricopeptide (TPR) repeat protein